ncbi:MAG TPA: nucleoside deaminase [Candidatus Dependentiae bacterium]|nr:nucleoside deaminase [Candidatus Dependentiae bacterium]HRQ62648.1 nucleoside deaminase [Candidatus Dependentiae bacterium]
MNASVFGKEKDIVFMQEALQEACSAQKENEVPIGAVVVNAHGEIIGRGYNQVEQKHSQCAHAECIAITHAGNTIGDWRLEGCWLYVTLEPCAMCMGLIRLSRINGVVYGASSPLFGYRLDNAAELSVYNRDLLAIIEGVESEKSEVLLKKFFQQKRKHGGEKS